MKNNCDISGKQAQCLPDRGKCDFADPKPWTCCDYLTTDPHQYYCCSSTAAIKDALRAKEYEDSKEVYEGNGYTVITHGNGKYKIELDIQESVPAANKNKCPNCKGTGKVSNRRLGDYCPTPEPCKECNNEE